MSFAAVGRKAETVVSGHSLEFGLGERSPLARLYDLDAFVLLLGVDHGSSTSLHLAEYRAGTRPHKQEAGPVRSAGARLVRQRAAVDFGAGWLQRRVARQSPA